MRTYAVCFSDTDYKKIISDEEPEVDDYVGCIRVGEICFDLVVREDDYFDVDCYVLYENDNYGETRFGIPYAFADGFAFDIGYMRELDSYSKFVNELIKRCDFFIEDPSNGFNLAEHANKPLADWN